MRVVSSDLLAAIQSETSAFESPVTWWINSAQGSTTGAEDIKAAIGSIEESFDNVPNYIDSLLICQTGCSFSEYVRLRRSLGFRTTYVDLFGPGHGLFSSFYPESVYAFFGNDSASLHSALFKKRDDVAYHGSPLNLLSPQDVRKKMRLIHEGFDLATCTPFGPFQIPPFYYEISSNNHVALRQFMEAQLLKAILNKLNDWGILITQVPTWSSILSDNKIFTNHLEQCGFISKIVPSVRKNNLYFLIAIKKPTSRRFRLSNEVLATLHPGEM